MNRLRFAALGLALLAVPAFAQGLAPGSPLPAAADASLRSTTDATVSLRASMGENGLVVVFWSNVCPWTERYAERLVLLARDYQPAGVNFIAVNSNDSTRFPEEDFASMRRMAAQAGFPFPYVVDDGSLAAAFGVRSAPQVYFFGADGALKYVGAIDSSPADPARVQTAYLRDAMDQVLAGQEVEVRQTNALGCTIKTP